MEKLIFLFILLIISIVIVSLEEVKVIYATVPQHTTLFESSMFLEVIEPEEIAYLYRIRPARNFGEDFPYLFHGIDLTPALPYHACSPLTNSETVRGGVALVERGGCSFVTKTLNVEEAGALAILIADNDHTNDHSYIDMIQDDTEREPTIPSLFMLGKDGFVIKQTLDKLNLESALINIPVNVTGIPLPKIHRPPWTLW